MNSLRLFAFFRMAVGRIDKNFTLYLFLFIKHTFKTIFMGGGRNRAAQTTPFKEIALKIIVAPLHEYSSIKYLVTGGHTKIPKINIIITGSKIEESVCIPIFYIL